MKTRILTVAMLAFIGMAFAQTKEVKSAEKANAKQEFAEAKASLKAAEAAGIASEDDKWKLRYYLAKGQAFYGTGIGLKPEDGKVSAEAFKMAAEIDAESQEAKDGLLNTTNAILTSALNDYNTQKFSSAMTNFATAYELSPKDTIYLYNAAIMAGNAQDYDSSLKYYEQLKDLGYQGRELEFYATNASTGEEESFASSEERDAKVLTGEFIKPEDRKSDSKRADIVKKIALIYINNDQTEEAIDAIENARAENPDDVGLILSEASIYNELGDMEKFKSLTEEAVAKDPNNATLYYNLGVSTAQLGDIDGAVNYYKKALEIEPGRVNAMINIAAAILSKDTPLFEEMNALGTSAKDYKRYDEIAAQRKAVFQEAIPYLEGAIEINPDNVEATRTLMNIYYQIDEETKAEAMKTKLEALEGN